MTPLQWICIVLLIVLIGFYFWYRKRQV